MIGVTNFAQYFLVVSFIALISFSIGLICYNRLSFVYSNTNKKKYLGGIVCVGTFWLFIGVVYIYLTFGKSLCITPEKRLSETLIATADLDYISSDDMKHTDDWDYFKVNFGKYSEYLYVYKDTNKQSDIVVSLDKDKQKTIDIYEAHYELIPKFCYLINKEYVLYLSQEDYDKILSHSVLLQGK